MLELELDGALYVQEKVPGACTIFIAADVEELERRLRERATESTGEIEDRITIGRASSSSRPTGSGTWCETTTSTGRPRCSTAIVERELALAATIVRR